MQRPFQAIGAKVDLIGVDLIGVALEFAGRASQLVDIRDHRAKHRDFPRSAVSVRRGCWWGG